MLQGVSVARDLSLLLEDPPYWELLFKSRVNDSKQRVIQSSLLHFFFNNNLILIALVEFAQLPLLRTVLTRYFTVLNRARRSDSGAMGLSFEHE